MCGVLKKHKYCDPVKLMKFFILSVCGVFTIMQVSECINKLMYPPVSTHYYYLLNDTVKYPSVTICRTPAYKTWLFPKYGLYEYTELDTNFAFENFKFDTYNLEDFMEETTYNFNEIFSAYAFAGIGSNKDLEFSKTYHLNRGRCYTITPLVDSDKFSTAGGYFFYLIFNNTGLDSSEENGFQLFLHDPSEVLTFEDHQKDSFLTKVTLTYAESMEVALDVTEFRKLSSTNLPCISTESYSKSKCLEMCVHVQVAMNTNCSTPWLILPEGHQFPLCDEYIKIRDLIKDFRNSRSLYLRNCRCSMACDIAIYTPTIIKRKEEVLNAPSSTIHLYFESNLVSVMDEKAGYDFNQFVADVGGSLGFLLGLSVLSFMCLVEEICQVIVKKVLRKKQIVVENKDGFEKNTNNVNNEDCTERKSNIKKSDEIEEVKVKNDYKHIKDYFTEYHAYENNIFNKEEVDQFNKF